MNTSLWDASRKAGQDCWAQWLASAEKDQETNVSETEKGPTSDVEGLAAARLSLCLANPCPTILITVCNAEACKQAEKYLSIY